MENERDHSKFIIQRFDAYIAGAAKRSFDVAVFDDILDPHFINTLEAKLENVSFKRVDADTFDKLIDKGLPPSLVLSDEEKTNIEETFKGIAGSNTVQVEALAPDELPVSIVMAEFMRRWQEMSKLNGQADMFGGMMPSTYTLVVNGNHPLISKIAQESDAEKKSNLAKQLHDLALLSQGLLEGKELTQFIERSVQTLS
mgnify:FL=1